MPNEAYWQAETNRQLSGGKSSFVSLDSASASLASGIVFLLFAK